MDLGVVGDQRPRRIPVDPGRPLNIAHHTYERHTMENHMLSVTQVETLKRLDAGAIVRDRRGVSVATARVLRDCNLVTITPVLWEELYRPTNRVHRAPGWVMEISGFGHQLAARLVRVDNDGNPVTDPNAYGIWTLIDEGINEDEDEA